MQIIVVYETSKGFFLNKEEAYKKRNRCKIYGTYGSYAGNSKYEDVIETYALASDGKFFKLESIIYK